MKEKRQLLALVLYLLLFAFGLEREPNFIQPGSDIAPPQTTGKLKWLEGRLITNAQETTWYYQ